MSDAVKDSAVHYDPPIDDSIDDINAYLDGNNRSLYNFRDEGTDYYKVEEGLTREM